jgi:hypothetical protein
MLGVQDGFAGLSSGNAIRISDASSVGNRIIGNWCGVRGDGQIDPVAEDCFVLDKGASGNTIGGSTDAERNVLAASALGVGRIPSGARTSNSAIGSASIRPGRPRAICPAASRSCTARCARR